MVVVCIGCGDDIDDDDGDDDDGDDDDFGNANDIIMKPDDDLEVIN